MVGRVDFIVFFRNIPINKITFSIRRKGLNREFFYMKLRKLHDFDFTIFQISLNLSVVKYGHFKFANFNCREKFHVKTVQRYLLGHFEKRKTFNFGRRLFIDATVPLS